MAAADRFGSDVHGWRTHPDPRAYTPLADGAIQVSVWVGEKIAGAFVRGGWAERKFEADQLLKPHFDALVARLDCTIHSSDPNGQVCGERLQKSYLDETAQDAIIDWLEEHRLAYVAAIKDVLDLPE